MISFLGITEVKLLDHLLFLSCTQKFSQIALFLRTPFPNPLLIFYWIIYFFSPQSVVLGGLYILNATHLSIISANVFFQSVTCFLTLYVLSCRIYFLMSTKLSIFFVYQE